MSDRYTTSSTESWGSRLAGSIKGVLLGFLMFLISFIVLWWNEGRAVKTATGLTEGSSKVISVFEGDINPQYEGELIHITGNIVSNDTLTDRDFNISSTGLKLKRQVEMYQWIESTSEKKEKNLGGSETTTTTYDYSKTWKKTVINSNNFEIQDKYINPNQMPYENVEMEVKSAEIGAFNFSEDFIGRMNDYQSISLTPHQKTKSKRNTPKNSNKIYNDYNEIIYTPNLYTDSIATSSYVFIGDGTPQNPKIGDVKITFSEVTEEKVSIIAQQNGRELIPFHTETGTTISLLESGDVPANIMFETAQSRNTTWTWILRFIGFLMMFIGITKCFSPLVVLADVVPFIGRLLGAGISFFAGLAAFALSLTTIAIAWIAYRPVLAFSLLGIAVASLIFIFVKNKKQA